MMTLQKTMGKSSQKNQKNKNVFKVATGRSIKLKTKARTVVTNLKKLDLKECKPGNKDKTARIDKLLHELRNEVQNCKSKVKVNKAEQGNRGKQNIHKAAPAQVDTTTSLINEMQI